MNIKLKLESYLKGGYPIRECIDFWIFSKLVCLLENAMHLAMKEKQYSAVATNAKVLMRLLGLD